MLSTYEEYCWWCRQYGFGGPVFSRDEHARAVQFLTTEEHWMAATREYLRLLDR